jgi:starch synthase
MKILFVASEGAPFSKSGGLGDVIGSLPMELCKQGMDVRVILPKYGSIDHLYRAAMIKRKAIYIQLGWRQQYCGIEELEYKGVTFYFIDNEFYFKRDVLYGYGDEAERYAFFSKAVLESIPIIDFYPDLIHCHDWHAGMVSFLLKTQYQHRPNYQSIATVYTIHNLKYQGIFSKEIFDDLLGVDSKYFNEEELEFYGCINSMKAGIVFSDMVTTVSESYASEIQYPFFGEKLDGIIRKRKEAIYGIINGIDNEDYNPATDPRVYINYDTQTIENKAVNKERLQRDLGLEVNVDKPVMAIVSRLTKQKGLDLVACVIDEILAQDVQFIVLGTGESHYEDLFCHKAYYHSDKMVARLAFSEALARQIYSGADFLLMPSLFEPCGLAQLIALRYGTIPIVRETGGLKDTIEPFNEFTNEGNGFSFTNYNAHDMLNTIHRALRIYGDKEKWHILRTRAMALDFSWHNSAKKYIDLYKKVLFSTVGK